MSSNLFKLLELTLPDNDQIIADVTFLCNQLASDTDTFFHCMMEFCQDSASDLAKKGNLVEKFNHLIVHLLLELL